MVQVVKTSAFENVDGCLSSARALPNDSEQEQSPTFVKEIFANFIQHLEYRPLDPFIPVETTTTYKFLRSEFSWQMV